MKEFDREIFPSVWHYNVTFSNPRPRKSLWTKVTL